MRWCVSIYIQLRQKKQTKQKHSLPGIMQHFPKNLPNVCIEKYMHCLHFLINLDIVKHSPVPFSSFWYIFKCFKKNTYACLMSSIVKKLVGKNISPLVNFYFHKTPDQLTLAFKPHHHACAIKSLPNNTLLFNHHLTYLRKYFTWTHWKSILSSESSKSQNCGTSRPDRCFSRDALKGKDEFWKSVLWSDEPKPELCGHKERFSLCGF